MIKHPAIKAISAVIEIEAEPEIQKLIRSVLSPELSQSVSSRSSVSISSIDNRLDIRVEGRDLSSFRASATSILRLLSVIAEIHETIDNDSPQARRLDV